MAEQLRECLFRNRDLLFYLFTWLLSIFLLGLVLLLAVFREFLEKSALPHEFFKRKYIFSQDLSYIRLNNLVLFYQSKCISVYSGSFLAVKLGIVLMMSNYLRLSLSPFIT